MAYTVTASFSDEQRKIEGTWPIDMYVVNSSLSGADYLYYTNLSQDVYGFQMNTNGELTATTQLYTGLPIKRGNINTNTKGEITGVSINVPNTDRIIEAVIQSNEYLRGRDIHMLLFFAKYLPSGTGGSYIGESADHNAGIKETYYVDTVTSNEAEVSFICKSKFDIKKIVIPGRKFTRECSWDTYGATECGANATVVASWTTCDRTLAECKERSNEARFGGFPSVPRRGFIII